MFRFENIQILIILLRKMIQKTFAFEKTSIAFGNKTLKRQTSKNRAENKKNPDQKTKGGQENEPK
jgi:hypothetical protein